MSLYLIRIIASFEMRTLLRSWFFRIFTGGMIMGLGIFNIGMNIESSGAPWMYKALAASIPYANLIILNLGQAVVAVFLASEFLKQDRKNDTVEVIYVRSMTNGQYILGKTLGILGVFLVLNVIVLLLGIGFSFLYNFSIQSVFAYFTYPLLISVPTLVYILGLSFLLMVLVKNQAITFILLLGYIALTIFYLDKKAYHLFDFIAYQVPMMHSSISGFASFHEIFLHRSIYFLLGIGFILLTVYKLQRLPQSPRYSSLPLYVGIVFLCAGSFLAFRYLDLKKSVHDFRRQAVALNNRFASYPGIAVISCDLDLSHQGKTIRAEAVLKIVNRGDQAVDTLMFSLNPELDLNSITSNGKALTFKRDVQLIRVVASSRINPGDSLKITMQYSGGINENIAFLDRADEEFDANFNFEVFTMRRRYAFLQSDFVCLTSDLLWYPIAGTGYATSAPMRYEADFVKYTLRVNTRPDLTAISQGQVSTAGDGIFEFKPEYPLPKISLLIGNYVKYATTVDSIEYSVFAIRGHDYFKPYFDQIADTIPTLIRDLKKEYEAGLGLNYPFHRLMLAEVPVHFALINHVYSYASDAVQPEIVLSPEKGVLFNSSDFRARRYRLEKNKKNNNEEALPEEIQSEMFTQFVRNNFMAKRGQNFNYAHVINWQTYSLFQEYFSYFTRLQSDDWPVLGMAMEMYFSERNNKSGTIAAWYEDLTMDEKINLELSDASLEELLKSGIEPVKNERNQVTISELTQAKGLQLFNVLRARFGEKELDSLFTSLIMDFPHQTIPFEELNTRFQDKYSTSLSEQVQNWYVQRQLPGFLVRNISSYKVMDGEATRYQIRFQLSNPENTDGIVTLNVEMNDPNREQGRDNNSNNSFNADFSKKLFLPARSSFEVGYVFNSQPARMSLVTHISRNLPNNLITNLSGFDEIRNNSILDDMVPITFFDIISESNEIIVDNEDKNFSYKQAKNEAYLKSLINKKNKKKYNYTNINTWGPPREWRAVLRSEFNGNYIHSAYYTRGGTGERTATWKAVLPEKTSYDIYFYLNKMNYLWRRTNKTADYNFVVYHDNGMEKINKSSENAENGWNYLGTFYFSSDTARVELTNKTNGDIVFADAVKWVISE